MQFCIQIYCNILNNSNQSINFNFVGFKCYIALFKCKFASKTQRKGEKYKKPPCKTETS
jgi:hypothetical protein